MAWIYLVTSTAIAIAVVAFALQNPGPVTVRFLGWRIVDAPLAAVILGSGAVGGVLVSALALIQRWVLMSRIRRLESRARVAEQSPRPDLRDESAPRLQQDRQGHSGAKP